MLSAPQKTKVHKPNKNFSAINIIRNYSFLKKATVASQELSESKDEFQPDQEVREMINCFLADEVSISAHIKICAEIEKLWIIYGVDDDGALCFDDIL